MVTLTILVLLAILAAVTAIMIGTSQSEHERGHKYDWLPEDLDIEQEDVLSEIDELYGDPDPVEPEPADPDPVEPEPADPDPVEPEPNQIEDSVSSSDSSD